MMEFESGEVLTITSALTLFTKLQMILCGHVKDNDGISHDILHNRIEALTEVIDEMSGKVLIWCNFQRDVEQIKARLIADHGSTSVATYYGPDSNDKRAENIEAFKKDPACRFLVATLRCGGWGLNLQHCHNAIYYSNSFSLEQRLQSEDRLHRSGQTSKVTYVDLVVPKSLDEKVVAALKSKKDVADMVLTGWRELLF